MEKVLRHAIVSFPHWWLNCSHKREGGSVRGESTVVALRPVRRGKYYHSSPRLCWGKHNAMQWRQKKKLLNERTDIHTGRALSAESPPAKTLPHGNTKRSSTVLNHRLRGCNGIFFACSTFRALLKKITLVGAAPALRLERTRRLWSVFFALHLGPHWGQRSNQRQQSIRIAMYILIAFWPNEPCSRCEKQTVKSNNATGSERILDTHSTRRQYATSKY